MPDTAISASKYFKSALDWLSEQGRRRTDEIDTDLSLGLETEIQEAITGRYATFRRLYDDSRVWQEFQFDLRQHQSLWKAEEPWLAAAALALRPAGMWEWNLVEAWSWVYRHAALLKVAPDEFSEWVEHQNPDSSREFVTALLMRSGRVLTPEAAGNNRAGSDV